MFRDNVSDPGMLCRDTEQFLNNVLAMCSLQRSLPYCAILQHWVNRFNYFKSQKNTLAQNNQQSQPLARRSLIC